MSAFTRALALIALAGGAVAGPAAAATSGSDFTLGAEGWTAVAVANDLTLVTPIYDLPTTADPPVVYVATGGNPGGRITVTDPNADWTHFVAPATFLGNQAALFGGSLSYDMQQQANGGLFINGPNVALVGTNGTVLVYGSNNPPPEAPAWQHYDVPFATDAAGWFVGSVFGPAATGQQLSSVLGGLQALLINAEFANQIAEVTALDNVRFQTGAAVPLPPAILGFAAALGLLRARRRV
ncbi:MAG: hypothetical protein HY749_17150 [Gammaproteobacteria bacterium]|nr:hypothetical protein [Gammaproteobacteria bacterium]MBI5618691.1 hypothetical protein [Gammaproteobacteria bacterium]